MDVLEDLRQAQQRVVDRLAELAPLASEYEQLSAEAARLGLATPSASATKQTAPAASRAKRSNKRSNAAKKTTAAASRSRSPRAGQSRQQSGGRSDKIVELVAQRPGVTVKELSEELGVNATGLYTPVRKLVAEGKIAKNGKSLQPAG